MAELTQEQKGKVVLVISELFDDLQKEIWMYLFKGKKAQPDFMDLISQEEQEQSGLNNMRVAL